MPVGLNFMVGGEAGQGVQSLGFLLAKVFTRGGYHVFADQDYESRIRGGHNFFRVRVSETRVAAIVEPVDILVVLNKESIDLHQGELAPGGVVIFDGEKIKDVGSNSRFLNVPLERLAEEKAGDKLMTNTVALGAAVALVDYDFEMVAGLLSDHFGSGQVAESNIRAARAGYEHVKTGFGNAFSRHIKPLATVKRMLLNGNEAISLGAIAAGCKFMAAYPMTPTTSIIEYLAAKSKDYGIVMVPAEDEIAAINMVIGAGYAGVRAMTATSGSGFCLMVEGLGLAAMTETPVVIVEGQRPGPAIGLPTRTEQGDLQFVLHAHQGDFPRAVLAPATIADCFWATVKAFNLAEKYQLPVIILTDHYLAGSYTTVDAFDLSRVTIERGLLQSDDSTASEYRRYKITDSGISPRAFPGQGKALVVADSDEHDEQGHLIEDGATRTAQVQKRLRKLIGLKQEINTPPVYGPGDATTTLIGWGSTHGAIQEAVDILNQGGSSVNMLQLNELCPFPTAAVADIIGRARRSYIIENNATGQLAYLIKAETGRDVSGHILKYDGRPFTPVGIAEAVKKEGG